MTAKKKNLILIIVSSVILLFLFIPGFCFSTPYERHTEYKNYYFFGYPIYGYTNEWFSGNSEKAEFVSFIKTLEPQKGLDGDYLLVGIGIIISLIVCIVLFSLQYRRGENMLSTALAPIVPLILMCIYYPILRSCCKASKGVNSFVSYRVSILFYLIIFFLAILLVISVASYITTRKNGNVEYVYVTESSSDKKSAAKESDNVCFWCNGTGKSEDANGDMRICLHCHGTGKQK